STPSSPHIPHTPTSPLFPYTTLFRSLHRLAPAVRESGPVERPSDAVAQRRAGETVQASERLEVLARGEQRIDRQFLGNDAESAPDRKSTRLNSSHSQISYAVFCLKKK